MMVIPAVIGVLAPVLTEYGTSPMFRETRHQSRISSSPLLLSPVLLSCFLFSSLLFSSLLFSPLLVLAIIWAKVRCICLSFCTRTCPPVRVSLHFKVCDFFPGRGRANRHAKRLDSRAWRCSTRVNDNPTCRLHSGPTWRPDVCGRARKAQCGGPGDQRSQERPQGRIPPTRNQMPNSLRRAAQHPEHANSSPRLFGSLWWTLTHANSPAWFFLELIRFGADCGPFLHLTGPLHAKHVDAQAGCAPCRGGPRLRLSGW
jgi:hypothetical protein